MLKKEPNLNFNEYIYSLSNEERLTVLKYCSQFGDANQVLCSLLDTPPCYQTKKSELRINKDFLFWHYKDYSEEILSIKKIDSISHCYHSLSSEKNRSKIGLIFNDNSTFEIRRLDAQGSVNVFRNLQHYIHGFENIKPYEANELNCDVKFPGYAIDCHYLFRENSLYLAQKKLFSNQYKEKLLVQDIQEIIWCNQQYSWDSDTCDIFELEVYTACDKYPRTIRTNSDHNAYKIAMELKKRIPHLLYGPNEEYKEIYNRSPAELMVLAKGKMKL